MIRWEVLGVKKRESERMDQESFLEEADPRGPGEIRSDSWGRSSLGTGEENVAAELSNR